MFEGTADKALAGGTFGLALMSSGNPLKAMTNPLVTASMFTSPSKALQKRQSKRQDLLTKGRVNPAVKRQAMMMKRSSMEKSASFWSGLKRVVTSKPAKAVGIIGGATAGLMGVDYLQGQMKTIDKSRSYRNMMQEYGTELKAVARDTETPVPEKEIRNAYNALYTLSPDIAKDPTLAAAQMAPLIREIGTVHGHVDPGQTKPRVMLEHGLEPFVLPSKLQGGVPRTKAVSDYAAQAAGVLKGVGTAADLLQPSSAERLAEEYAIAKQRGLGSGAAQLEHAEALSRARERGGILERDAQMENLQAQEAMRAEEQQQAQLNFAFDQARARALGQEVASLQASGTEIPDPLRQAVGDAY